MWHIWGCKPFQWQKPFDSFQGILECVCDIKCPPFQEPHNDLIIKNKHLCWQGLQSLIHLLWAGATMKEEVRFLRGASKPDSTKEGKNRKEEISSLGRIDIFGSWNDPFSNSESFSYLSRWQHWRVVWKQEVGKNNRKHIGKELKQRNSNRSEVWLRKW